MCLLAVRLTEHHLQLHQTTHKVVELDGQVHVGVSSHQHLVDGVVQSETWRRTTGGVSTTRTYTVSSC